MFEIVKSFITDIFGSDLQSIFYVLGICYLLCIPLIKFIRWLKYGKYNKHDN